MSLQWREGRRGEAAILLLIFGVLVCIAFFHSPGTFDRDEWLRYMALARQKGILAAYPNAASVDYPPLSFVMLGILARIADVLRISDFAALKISLMILTLTCASIVAFLEKPAQSTLAVIAFLTLFIDAILEVYIDIYFVLFLLLAVWCFQRRYLSVGTAIFAIACLVKWQPIILSPLVLLYVLPRRPTLSDLSRLAPAAAVCLVVFGLYAEPMIKAFALGFSDPMLSGNGLNLNWLITGLMEWHKPTPDGLVVILSKAGGVYTDGSGLEVPATATYSFLLFASSFLRYFCYLVSLYYFYNSDRGIINFVRSSIICFMAYFTFGDAVHENHACVAAILAICWFAMDRTRYLEAILLAMAFNINLLVFYGFDGSGLHFRRVVGWDVTLYLAAFDLILFFFLWLPIASQALSGIRETMFRSRAKLAGGRWQ